MGLLTDRINNKLGRSNLIDEHPLNREPVSLSDATSKFHHQASFVSKLFSCALFMRGYSFQLDCIGNSFMQNFATFYFENETWW